MMDAARSRRIAVGVGSLATLAVAAATVLPHLFPGPADPRATGQGAASEPGWVEEGWPPCPTPIPRPSAGPGTGVEPVPSDDERARLLVWDARTYLGSVVAQPPERGEIRTMVTCSLAEMGVDASLDVPLPWPEVTAGGLSSGTDVFAVVGVPSRCYLIADDDQGRSWVFRAHELATDAAPPDCAGVTPPVR